VSRVFGDDLMARIRSIKPEFFTHPEVVALSIPARLLLISLLTQADDEGRLYDQPTRIRGEAFGEDDKVNVPRLLEELAQERRIHRYQAEGRACIQVANFSVHQRVSHPTLSRIPPEVLGNGSGEFRETLPTTRARADLEQGTGNREGNGAGSKDLEPDLDPDSKGSFDPYPGEELPLEQAGEPDLGPDADQLSDLQRGFLASAIRHNGSLRVKPSVILRLQRAHGRELVTDALEAMAASPPRGNVERPSAYFEAIVAERVESSPEQGPDGPGEESSS
jgi:hypothetical protein